MMVHRFSQGYHWSAVIAAMLLQACGQVPKQEAVTTSVPHKPLRYEQVEAVYSPYVLCSDCPLPTPKTLVAQSLPPAASTITPTPQSLTVKTAPVAVVDEGLSLKKSERIEQQILFAYASARLDARAEASIASIVPLAKAVEEVLIVGSASAEGDPDRNVNLSLRRGAAVRRRLAEGGVDRRKIHLEVRSKEFVASNDTEAHRSQNRRATVTIEINSKAANSSYPR